MSPAAQSSKPVASPVGPKLHAASRACGPLGAHPTRPMGSGSSSALIHVHFSFAVQPCAPGAAKGSHVPGMVVVVVVVARVVVVVVVVAVGAVVVVVVASHVQSLPQPAPPAHGVPASQVSPFAVSTKSSPQRESVAANVFLKRFARRVASSARHSS